MIECFSNVYYKDAFALINHISSWLLYFAVVIVHTSFNTDNSVIPNSSIYKFQLSSPHLPDRKVKDLPFELTPEATFVEK